MGEARKTKIFWAVTNMVSPEFKKNPLLFKYEGAGEIYLAIQAKSEKEAKIKAEKEIIKLPCIVYKNEIVFAKIIKIIEIKLPR